MADATRLRLLLRNLLENTRRHAADAASPPVVFLRQETDGRLALGVRDFGPGVPPEQGLPAGFVGPGCGLAAPPAGHRGHRQRLIEQGLAKDSCIPMQFFP